MWQSTWPFCFVYAQTEKEISGSDVMMHGSSPSRRPSFTILTGFSLCIVSLALELSAAQAQRLPLPAGATAVLQQIRDQCPECLSVGFTACGASDIGYGRAFASNVLRGTPPRGYLVTYVMNGEEFRRLARTADYATLTKALRDRFGQARLIVLEDRLAAACVLEHPEVAVIFPKALHQCVQDLHKPWGCCVSDCRHECCEKELGSPSVQLTWRDPWAGETVIFKFHHGVGMSTLERWSMRRTLYFCLTDQRGRLSALGH